MPSNMDWILQQSKKVLTNEEVWDVTKRVAPKMIKGAMLTTNPMVLMGTEAAMAGSHALLFDALNKKQESAGELVEDTVMMAGAAYAGRVGMEMAAQTAARSELTSDFAAKIVANRMGLKKEGELAVSKMVNNAAKRFIKPVNMGKLGLGGAGMAAGLLYTMINNKTDSKGQVALDMAGGAGLVMMGHEIYKYVQNQKEKPTLRKKFTKNLSRTATETKSGKLVNEMFNEVLQSPSGKEMTEAMKDVLATDEAKPFMSFFNNILDSKWGSVVEDAFDPAKLDGSLNSIGRQINAYLSSPRGEKVAFSLKRRINAEVRGNAKDLVNAYKEDVITMMRDNMEHLGKGLGATQAGYGKYEEQIKKMLSIFLPDREIESIHNFMNDGVSGIVQKIDHATSKEVTDKKQGKETEEKKETRKEHAQEESINVATDAEGHKGTTANKLEQQITKNKHDVSMKNIASQRRLTNWFEKGKMLGVIGLGAFAVASVMDTSDRLDKHSRTSRMVNEEQQNANKKQQNEQSKYHQQAYGAMNMGDVVTELFNSRIGHHKMGSAKFAPNQYQMQGQTYSI